MKIKYILAVLAAKILFVSAVIASVSDGVFEAKTRTTIAHWSDESDVDICELAGGDTNILIEAGNLAVFSVAHNGLGTALLINSTAPLTVGLTTASPDTGVGSLRLEPSIKIETLPPVVLIPDAIIDDFTSLTFTDFIETKADTNDMRIGNGTIKTRQISFTTGDPILGDDLFTRLAVNGTPDFMAYENVSLNDVDVAAIPEAFPISLLGLGVLALLLRRHR